MTEKRNKRISESGHRANRTPRNPPESKRLGKASSVPPGLTPGYDYVLDREEDDLDPDYVPDPDDYCFDTEDPEEYR